MMRNSMTSWRTVLECNVSELREVNIRSGIFQGDSLSPLLFVIAMIPLTSILRWATPGYVFKKQIKDQPPTVHRRSQIIWKNKEKDGITDKHCPLV